MLFVHQFVPFKGNIDVKARVYSMNTLREECTYERSNWIKTLCDSHPIIDAIHIGFFIFQEEHCYYIKYIAYLHAVLMLGVYVCHETRPYLA